MKNQKLLAVLSLRTNLNLLNDNRDRVTGFYWSSECDVSLLVHGFS